MDALVADGVLHDDNGDLLDVAPVKIEVDAIRPWTEVFVWERRM